MRVLLIEDDSAMARSIELMLRSEGFNVYTTDLGEEGIDLAAQGRRIALHGEKIVRLPKNSGLNELLKLLPFRPQL